MLLLEDCLVDTLELPRGINLPEIPQIVVPPLRIGQLGIGRGKRFHLVPNPDIILGQYTQPCNRIQLYWHFHVDMLLVGFGDFCSFLLVARVDLLFGVLGWYELVLGGELGLVLYQGGRLLLWFHGRGLLPDHRWLLGSGHLAGVHRGLAVGTHRGRCGIGAFALGDHPCCWVYEGLRWGILVGQRFIGVALVVLLVVLLLVLLGVVLLLLRRRHQIWRMLLHLTHPRLLLLGIYLVNLR